MSGFTRNEIDGALKTVTSSIEKCERLQPKFAEGTPQLSLSRNRIKALKIAECLLKNDGSIQNYSKDELEKALPQIISVRSKTANARKKHDENSSWYKRMTPAIEAMDVCRALIEMELTRRETV